jgi:hypothetical protein
VASAAAADGAIDDVALPMGVSKARAPDIVDVPPALEFDFGMSTSDHQLGLDYLPCFRKGFFWASEALWPAINDYLRAAALKLYAWGMCGSFLCDCALE